VRTTTTIATFTKPFSLPGFDKPHAPGSFEIRTDEERLDTMFEAWRRLGTRILLPNRWGVEAWSVDPQDLREALSLDAQNSPPTPAIA
jgi:hypothetical protein